MTITYLADCKEEELVQYVQLLDVSTENGILIYSAVKQC
jgi:hypothetical protein